MIEKSQNATMWPSLMDPFRSFGQRVADWFAPPSDASSDEKDYRISIELPGVREDDVTLTVENGVVSVKGEKRTEREEKGDTWYFSERQYGSFSRTFRLPADADQDKVGAELKDGVLTVTVPKRAETAPETRRIKVARG